MLLTPNDTEVIFVDEKPVCPGWRKAPTMRSEKYARRM